MKDKRLRNLVQISQFLNSGETTTDVKKLTLDQLVRVQFLGLSSRSLRNSIRRSRCSALAAFAWLRRVGAFHKLCSKTSKKLSSVSRARYSVRGIKPLI